MSTDQTRLGPLNEPLPASDTAPAGLNGRLQRLAQHLSGFKATTATHSSAPSGTSSVTILAANTARKGARIRNSDANPLHIDFSGGTATVDRAHVTLAQYQSVDVPAGYTGLITGLWAADGSGVAGVVEFT